MPVFWGVFGTGIGAVISATKSGQASRTLSQPWRTRLPKPLGFAPVRWCLTVQGCFGEAVLSTTEMQRISKNHIYLGPITDLYWSSRDDSFAVFFLNKFKPCEIHLFVGHLFVGAPPITDRIIGAHLVESPGNMVKPPGSFSQQKPLKIDRNPKGSQIDWSSKNIIFLVVNEDCYGLNFGGVRFFQNVGVSKNRGYSQIINF